MIMGFTEDPKEVFMMAGGNLGSMCCILFYKVCQELEMETEKVFLGVPTTTECKVLETNMTQKLMKLEKSL